MIRARIRFRSFLALAVLFAGGCGTTKWSDSARTATEQLLISDSIDRAVSEIDFSVLAGESIYVDTRFIATTLDQNYLVSTLRQHMLASGCVIHDEPEDATYVVEVRSGAMGTNRQDVLFGVPATNLPAPGVSPTGGASIPEIALAKRTNQQAVCKLAVYAYDRISGHPVWQSGNHKIASKAQDSWIMGAGPIQRGTIYEGTAFAGEKLALRKKNKLTEPSKVAREIRFGTDQFPELARRPDAPAPVNEPVYTPPVVPPPKNPNAPPEKLPGPQGNLTPQSVLPPSASPAAGAIQTYQWAQEYLRKQPT